MVNGCITIMDHNGSCDRLIMKKKYITVSISVPIAYTLVSIPFDNWHIKLRQTIGRKRHGVQTRRGRLILSGSVFSLFMVTPFVNRIWWWWWEEATGLTGHSLY